jgi:hypothetical protein
MRKAVTNNKKESDPQSGVEPPHSKMRARTEEIRQ